MAVEGDKFDKELAGLKIDRTKRGREGPAAWAKWWILVGMVLFIGLGVWRYGFAGAGVREVDTYRVAVETLGGSKDRVILNAAGYIVAHHKIEVASKVVGRVR
jgi:HlyD family secretion protein